MVNVAVLGYGVVGSGVVEVLKMNREIINRKAETEISLKYVLDLRDFEGDPVQEFITHDFNTILNDDSIKVVVEVMGGLNPAYDFVKQSLLKCKNVVTSNKELVAKHGTELLEIAKNNSVNFLFEASVGGGIPIIRTIKEGLTADDIYKLEGILNGTTNYILTKMTKDKADYKEALRRAQEKGYAEKDPTNDVEGFDTVRKLAILISLITRKFVDFEDIEVEGISKISPEDIKFADAIGGTIKLIAFAEKFEDKYIAFVSPVVLNQNNPLSAINNAFNAVLLNGNAVDELMFYGKGAGKLPTASAVVGDIVNAARHERINIGYFWSDEKLEIISDNGKEIEKMITVSIKDLNDAKAEIQKIFNVEEFITIEEYPNKLAFLAREQSSNELKSKVELLKLESNIVDITSILKTELRGE